MTKLLKWLGIQEAFQKGLIARIISILCLLYMVFRFGFGNRQVGDDAIPNLA